MRFMRFSLALLALLIGFVFVTPLQAQMRNAGRGGDNSQRVGRLPKLKGVAGATPDSVNYQVSQTTGAITPGTNPVTGFNCGVTPLGDDCMATVTLPFTFKLYDQEFSQVNVSTNGNLQFVSNNADYGQGDVCFPLPQFNYAILAHWGDLTVGGANEGVFTSISGSAPNQVFNIEWRTSLLGNSPASLNFQVRLYENLARFDVVFGTAPGGGRDVTVGVQRGAGSPYTEFSCHQNALRNGMQLVFTGNPDTALFIAGRITDSDGNPVAGVNVNLAGSSSGMVTTDGTGDYIFPGLTSGGTYSVTATQAGFSFFPQVRNFGTGFRAFTGNFIVNFIRTAPPNAGDILISEFRFRGEDVFTAVNEFVEIQNNTNQGITVNVTDGSPGWLVTTIDPSINFIIPNGTTIPARGHYLAGNGSGYNLFSYGAADTFYSGDIPDSGGVAIFSTANSGSLDLAHRLDAAGFTGADALYREGAGLISPGAIAGNYSFVRTPTRQFSGIVPCCKLVTGGPQDTNDNAADFQFVSSDGGIYGGVQSTLGAPGPQNTASPIQHNAQFKSALVDPVAGSTNAPNRVRDSTPNSCGGPNCTLGTLTIRRRFTNNTGHGVTKLRFRIVNVTTLGSIVNANPETYKRQIFKLLDPATTAGADLRALDSPGSALTITGGTVVQVRGLTVEQGSPTVTIPQPLGGGLNSSMAVGVITVAQPLALGENVNVEFRLGVQTGGGFRFFVNIEALP